MASENEDYIFDTEKWAGNVLDTVLNEEKTQAKQQQESQKIAVRDERQNRPIIDTDTGRDRSRVLFVTTDKAILDDNSSIRKHYIDVSSVFDEVHILVFTIGKYQKTETIRLAANVWVYPVQVSAYWHIPFIASREARERFVFNESVRPDIIVGVDPLSAGLGAFYISKNFNRPWQLHVFKNPLSILVAHQYTWLEKFITRMVYKRAKSIRTKTDHIKEIVKKYCKKNCNIEVLPKFYNFKSTKDTTPEFDLHKKYPAYAFIIATFGPLTGDSHLHDVFAAAKDILVNPRVGMIVVGSGPAKKLFEEKVEILGINRNVAFLESDSDRTSILKTSDMLLELNQDDEGDERIVHAASLELPVLAVETEMRSDLFTNGQSAFLCKPGDLICVKQGVSKLLNAGAMRKKLAEAAQYIVNSRIDIDPANYLLAYRDSIETVLLNKK